MSNVVPNQNHFTLYTTPEGDVTLNVLLQNETIWLTQKAMSLLFDTSPQNITIHLKNIFESGELSESTTCKDFLQVQIEGKREVSRNQKFYNLDAIISVGYRVNSSKATQFRIWATQTLKEYMIKGFYFFILSISKLNKKIWRTWFKALIFLLSTKTRINYSHCWRVVLEFKFNLNSHKVYVLFSTLLSVWISGSYSK